jgi:hypothetical protein
VRYTFHHCDQTAKKSDLEEEEFILTHGFSFSPQWAGSNAWSWGKAEHSGSWSRVSHLMVARKQRDSERGGGQDKSFKVIAPSDLIPLNMSAS